MKIELKNRIKFDTNWYDKFFKIKRKQAVAEARETVTSFKIKKN